MLCRRASFKSTIRRSTTQAERQVLLSDSDAFPLFAMPWGDEVVVLANPRKLRDPSTGTTVTVASVSNTIGAPTPVTIADELYDGFFTTLVPTNRVDAFQLRKAQEQPEDIEGSPTAQVPDDDGAMVNVPPSMARLNFGDVDAAYYSVVCCPAVSPPPSERSRDPSELSV